MEMPAACAIPVVRGRGLECAAGVQVYGPKVAVHDLSLDLVEGQMVALLGHNGAGALGISMSASVHFMRYMLQLKLVCSMPAHLLIHTGLFHMQLTGIWGHAGKTTALGMLSGLTRPTSGECYVQGHAMTSSPALARQALGFCPQQNVLFPRLTVLEHLKLYAAIKAVPGGFSGRPAADAAAEMMEVGPLVTSCMKSTG